MGTWRNLQGVPGLCMCACMPIALCAPSAPTGNLQFLAAAAATVCQGHFKGYQGHLKDSCMHARMQVRIVRIFSAPRPHTALAGGAHFGNGYQGQK